MSTLIPDYEHWQYTPVIPKLYWDAYSAEERIKRICLTLDKMRSYINNTTEQFNELSEDFRTQMAEQSEDFRTQMAEQSERMDDLSEQFTQLQKLVEEMTAATAMYDPVRGYTGSSVDATRDIVRNLDYHGVTVKELAEKPVTVATGEGQTMQTVPPTVANLPKISDSGDYPTAMQIAMAGNILLYRDSVPRLMPMPSNTRRGFVSTEPSDGLTDGDGDLTVSVLSNGIIRDKFFKKS